MKDSFTLNDAYKRFTGDQDKVLTPRETIDNFLNKAAGAGLDILRETRRVDRGRLGIPVYSSICGQDAKNMTGTAKQMGKGATPVQAEASAIMELVERFSLYRYSANPDNFQVNRQTDLKDRSMDFGVLARSVDDSSGNIDAVGRYFAGLPLRWTTAWNLTRGEKVLLPFDWFFTINQFNGSCAGNCNEEALCQGICEVVERHVCCDIARHRLLTPAIRPESADHPAVTEMIAKYQAAGIRIYLSDFTMGLGLPTVGVLAHDPATFPDRSELVWTAGTAPDPRKAMSRALTEAAQLGGDFDTGACYVASGLPKFTRLEEVSFITGVKPYLDITDLPDLSDDNIRVEVERCLSTLADHNLEVYIVQTTDPLLGLPAFYVIIPGTRFLQRAENASAGMFAAKLTAEKFLPKEAISRLSAMKDMAGPAYYISYYLGQSHVLAGDADTALGHFSEALGLNPSAEDIPGIQSAIGQIFKDRGQYREALKAFEEGLALDAERTDILNLAGFCHFKLGEHEKAVERFAAILALDPSSAIDYANMAVNYRAMGQIQKALYYYQQALAIDPSIDFARQHLEELLAK